MSDFLLELRSEEIPARMQAKARDDLARLFAAELARAGIEAGPLTTYATPRRLALIARGLPSHTDATSEEIKGPKTGAPPQALDGFLRKTGLARDQLVERDGVLFAVIERAGRATADVLAEAIPAIIRAFPWPKSMRWGDASLSTESLRWVRPLQGIVALFGDDVVACEIAGIASGRATTGHRFHAHGPISIASAASYADQLRAAHVIVDQDARAALIRTRAMALAAEAGLVLIEDEGLVAENAGLTEWPVPLLGRFDAAFLEVPPEVIQLTARVNQKYFVCSDAAGKLANAFICTANIDAADGGAMIVEGNRKVLTARLADAKFFYDTDLKVRLEDQAAKLDRIVFHEKLGTVADKVARVARLARWLVEEGIVTAPLPRAGGAGGGGAPPSAAPADSPHPNPSPEGKGLSIAALATLAERAARLCKADLVTGMVGEFPELQGVMGGYYAAAQGEDARVAAAIRDHYKPVGQGDDVPTEPVTVAVSLADKLDTLFSFFGIREYPTGSKDPFALRRSSIGIVRLILANNLLMHTDAPIGFWLGQVDTTTPISQEEIGRRSLLTDAPNFLVDRLEVQLRDSGLRHDFIEASRYWDTRGDGRLDRIKLRAEALQSFIATEDGANLLAGYKRAANILKKEEWDDAASQPSRHPEPAESSLIAALDTAEPATAAAIGREDFTAAMAALASLRAPIDAFFTGVIVNDADPAKRAARLHLLARVRDAVHTVADFSKIEG